MTKKLVAVSAIWALLSVSVALAQTGTSSSQGLSVCLRSATGNYKTALTSASTVYKTAIKTANDNYNSAVASANKLSDRKAKKTALNQARKALQEAMRKANQDLQTAKHATRNQYTADKKACQAASQNQVMKVAPPAPLTTTTPAPLPPPLSPPPATVVTKSFTIHANNNTADLTTITVSKGTLVQITFSVNAENTYHGGLDFRSSVLNTGTITPGNSKTVSFTASNSFIFTPYWPLTDIQKSYAINIVVQ